MILIKPAKARFPLPEAFIPVPESGWSVVSARDAVEAYALEHAAAAGVRHESAVQLAWYALMDALDAASSGVGAALNEEDIMDRIWRS